MVEKIVKIGENNVEVTTSKTVIDINGVEFEVWDEPESYGKERLDEETVAAKQSLTDANALNEKVYKQNLINKATSKINKLKLIQTKMNK